LLEIIIEDSSNWLEAGVVLHPWGSLSLASTNSHDMMKVGGASLKSKSFNARHFVDPC
jgi:hypothetical protein